MIHRDKASYSNLSDIITELDSEHADLVWVGKNYSKRDLINDLKQINKNTLNNKVCDNASCYNSSNYSNEEEG